MVLALVTKYDAEMMLDSDHQLALFCPAKIKCQGQYFHAPDTQDYPLSIRNSADLSCKFTWMLTQNTSVTHSIQQVLYLK